MEDLRTSLARSATVFAISGISDDGWCEPAVSFRLGTNAPIHMCEFDLWLKSERGRQRSHFRARAGADTFEFDVPHDVPVRVQIACRAAAGSVLDVALDCDNEVADKGGDLRRISFKLNGLVFS